MPVNHSAYSLLLPAKDEQMNAPRDDVAPLIDTFRGYDIHLYSEHNYRRQPLGHSNELRDNSIIYNPSLDRYGYAEIVHHVTSTHFRMMTRAVPDFTVGRKDHPSDVGFNHMIRQYIAPQISGSHQEQYYGDNAQRMKSQISSYDLLPAIVSSGDKIWENPDVQVQEADTQAELNALVDDYFNGPPGVLHIAKFLPLEPGQLRLWVSVIGRDAHCRVEQHPSDPYEGSTDGLEEFANTIMNNWVNDYNSHSIVAVDVARSNGYNALPVAPNPGDWIITNACTSNVALSGEGPVIPLHFGLPDLTSGTPIYPPKFRLL